MLCHVNHVRITKIQKADRILSTLRTYILLNKESDNNLIQVIALHLMPMGNVKMEQTAIHRIIKIFKMAQLLRFNLGLSHLITHLVDLPNKIANLWSL
jgi:hypothetical protein